MPSYHCAGWWWWCNGVGDVSYTHYVPLINTITHVQKSKTAHITGLAGHSIQTHTVTVIGMASMLLFHQPPS